MLMVKQEMGAEITEISNSFFKEKKLKIMGRQYDDAEICVGMIFCLG